MTMETRSYVTRCESCQRDDEVELATHWCIECSEPLCVNCNKYHNKGKATSQHKVITMEKMADLSPAVLNLSYKCKIHPGQSLAFFCPSHDMMCCVKCIPQSHQQCDQLISLDNEAQNTKKGKFIQTLEARIINTKAKLSEFVKKKRDNETDLNVQRNMIEKSIKSIRRRINEHFQQIEDQLIGALERAYKSCTTTLEKGIDQIEHKIQKMNVWYNDIIKLKENASDVHLFAVVKTVTPLQNKQEAYLSTLQEEHTKYNIEFIEEEAWRHLIADVPSFGELSVTETNPKKAKDYIRYKRSTMSDITSGRSSIIVTNRKSTFPTSKLDKGVKIRSACFLPDNRLALVSFHDNSIYTCSQDGEKKKKTKFPCKISDISTIDKQSLIIGTRTHLQLLQADTLKVKESISEIANDVIATAGNLVAIRSPSGNISVINTSGKLIREIHERSYGYIAIDRFGRVYYSNNAKNEVHCYFPDGSHHCIYRHENLKDPSGMITDGTGNLYVAGHLSHNIHKISGQGKKNEIILSDKDGINYPQRITLNAKSGELLVINNEWRNVDIYQI